MDIRYGYCTGFASSMTGPVCYPLLEDILTAGYDYAEFPLMQIAALSGNEFHSLARWLEQNGLGADCACNMFPPGVHLTGPEAHQTKTAAYLEPALARLERLGTKTIVLGSSAARDLPPSVSKETGYKQLAGLLENTVIPLLEQYDMTVAIEPISRYEANFIRTLAEGMTLVRMVNHPRIRLLADTIHMLREHEKPSKLNQYRPWLHHIHVSELDRLLPVTAFTPELSALISELRCHRPPATISFETKPAIKTDMALALAHLQSALEAD